MADTIEKNTLEAIELAHLLIDSISDKKGSDILLLDMREQSILTDYFLICSGDSNRQIGAIADAVAEDAKRKGGVSSAKQEGDPNSGWVLIDLEDLIVHIFSREMRDYYSLESLWQESHVVLRMP